MESKYSIEVFNVGEPMLIGDKVLQGKLLKCQFDHEGKPTEIFIEQKIGDKNHYGSYRYDGVLYTKSFIEYLFKKHSKEDMNFLYAMDSYIDDIMMEYMKNRNGSFLDEPPCNYLYEMVGQSNHTEGETTTIEFYDLEEFLCGGLWRLNKLELKKNECKGKDL